jgi:hypothetical protein
MSINHCLSCINHSSTDRFLRGTVIWSITTGLIALVMTSASFAGSDNPRTIIGYSSVHTVRPGDSVDFMVNAVDGGKYQAGLVRALPALVRTGLAVDGIGHAQTEYNWETHLLEAVCT